MPRTPSNPADHVWRTTVRPPIAFPDLTERMALRLSSVTEYTAPAHFGMWHRRFGAPEFSDPTGVFTPLVFVDITSSDLPVDPQTRFVVRGHTQLGLVRDTVGATRLLVREGVYAVTDAQDRAVAHARFVNAFTRYTSDPAARRVTTLPDRLGLGPGPSRVLALPALDDLLPHQDAAAFSETEAHVWHYGHTDANRHVNGMEYLRAMEQFVADALYRRGHDLKQLYFARARIVYRKPCFRGEAYRRRGWLRSEAPLVIAGAFEKASDPPGAPPAVAVELTLAQHDQ
jgi:hypothetical protein